MFENPQILNQVKEKDAPPQSELKALIFDVQGHSVHDGPGTRTTVFLAGCPLHCVWCCNPEGLFNNPTIMYSDRKCKLCYRCVEACPYNAITVNGEDGSLIHNRKMCDHCLTKECLNVCYHEAISVTGEYYTVDELMQIFQRDRQFWGSEGGVTFSGGEPLMHREYLREVLRRCKQSYIHTTIETTMCVPTDYLMGILPTIDWIFVDIKHMDPQTHKQLTGIDNRLILHNIRQVAAADWDGFIVIRIPVIPGLNDSEENIRATARFVHEIDLEVINILPFHRLGESKYRQLGRVYELVDQTPPPEEHMQRLQQLIQAEGLICFVGHKTPF